MSFFQDINTDSLGHIAGLAALVGLTYLIITIVFPPINFPKNIPTIPFYVSFLGAYTSMDQLQIYEYYLKDKLDKYGAVKIYFASRWNILVTKPEYLQIILKNEALYAKSGNHKKIPYAVLSRYTGDNVISAHGEVWKLYRSVITNSIQFPDKSSTNQNAMKLVELINNSIGSDLNSKSLPVGDFLQKFSLQNICQSMLGIDFKLLDDPNQELHQRLKYVKSQIFKSFYMNFPIFDQLPIPSRIKAKEEVDKFREYFTQRVKDEQLKNFANKSSAGYKLYEALQAGLITEKQFTDNAVIILVAGHENPQLLFTSLLYVLAKHPKWQTKLREELINIDDDIDLENFINLNAFIFETLRMFPPLGQIINRETTKDALLGGKIHIPKGTYIGYNNFVTGRDSTHWEDSNEFKPERWIPNDNNISEMLKFYKTSKINCTMAAFHGGKRACLGEKFALFETRLFLKHIVSNFKISLDPTWIDQLTPAGPICPIMLRINFEKLESKKTQ
ncbi:Cytochrome P450 2C26 [Wickerhamomyces ciferrii]|uniref:Cytochrome P450 2C26 n=1 Tax=Wickerhamomyces ciferrii (strain ATCC 14091 / BCRC 22168 / CBS 111 / JCM 3599 / NBRC 0793 / NRRL Y-1031 F-60-10) TaxID=1206466 RepID=K0KX62_WICCF|nr:Cytochrome P450 2C26 [Wickerhamomyces ciferrii]CCH45673.1 Cytochrome P450 2C26 [Wickerhamomyces ciferrii]